MHRNVLVVLFVTLLAAALGCASDGDGVRRGAASGELAPADVTPAAWSQERVTAIATQLAANVADLRDAVRDDPSSNIGSGQSNARHRLLSTLRVLKNETEFLARELKAGQSREATLPSYERIGTLARDAQEDARKMFLQEAIMSRITAAGDTWRQLTPYYIGVAG